MFLQRRQLNTLGLTALALPASLFGPATSAHAASVGQPAPDFTLTDVAGQAVQLSSFKGKPVVLEWNNPGALCAQALRRQSAGAAKGIHRQGRGLAGHQLHRNRQQRLPGPTPAGRLVARQRRQPQRHADGRRRHRRQALQRPRHPHMYIVNAQGLLVYAGGIDSIPQPASPTSQKPPTTFARAWTNCWPARPSAPRPARLMGLSCQSRTVVRFVWVTKPVIGRLDEPALRRYSRA